MRLFEKSSIGQLASIAEIVGAFAVVVSLIYVGIQVEDGTRATRSASANDTAAAISGWYADVGSDAQASKVVLNGFRQPDSLSPEEMAQFIYMMHGLYLQYQAAFYLSQEGTLDIELRESVTNTILGVRDLPGAQLYWRQRGNLFKPSFRDHVDQLMNEGRTNEQVEALYRGEE